MSECKTEPQSAEAQFAKHYAELLDVCLQFDIFIQYAENLLVALAGRLGEFPGGNDQQFLTWASDILRPAAERIATFCATFSELKHEYEGAIQAGIWRVLKEAQDLTGNNLPEIKAELA